MTARALSGSPFHCLDAQRAAADRVNEWLAQLEHDADSTRSSERRWHDSVPLLCRCGLCARLTMGVWDVGEARHVADYVHAVTLT
jgi:hypothetical protein